MAKSNIDKREIDDWVNLVLNINEFAPWSEYIFRGQAQDNWLLESTLNRALRNLKAKNKKELVETHRINFSSAIRGRRGQNPKSLTDNELWALGQHHGLYTPLLDWTESPWVALFFSFISPEKSITGRRSLWALHRSDIEGINRLYENKKREFPNSTVELVDPMIDDNNRLISQRGLFTKIAINNDIENWVAKAPNIGNWVTLFKYTFPDSMRQEALSYLNLMNINFSSLFPDIDGSSMDTNKKLLDVDYINERKKLELDGKLGGEFD